MNFISVDDHVVEAPDLWTRRLSFQRWGARIPHLESASDGSQEWIVDGVRVPLLGNGSVGALMRDPLASPRTWAEVPRAAYDPALRLRALDDDGVDYSVLYPAVAGVAGETFARVIKDPELELACVQAYNDWLIEEWAGLNSRFIAQCLVPLTPVAAAVGELRRAVGRGHRGLIFPAVPSMVRESAPHINDPCYDPIWRACEELAVPVCFHAGCAPQLQLPHYPGYSSRLNVAFEALTRPVSCVLPLTNLLLSQILERFPALKVVFGESALGWLGFDLETTEWFFATYALADQIAYKLGPIQAFRRQCFAVAWYDGNLGVLERACEFPGVENLLWSTNFPLAISSWPNSREQRAAVAAKLPPDQRDRIFWSNAAALYHLG
ncbi:MAG TPA: amidohydrolase family protein [Candidatus Binataceae bacterium]|nr:amidohydrolase family protein [Candidatus Binataceae bacterium]